MEPFIGFATGPDKPDGWDALPALSYSIAPTLLQHTELHAYDRHRLLGNAPRKEPTDAMESGIVIDSLLLGDESRLVEVDFPDFRTKAAKEAWQKAFDDDKTAVLKHKLAEARAFVAEKLKPRIGLTFERTKVRMAWMSDGAYCHAELDAFNPNGTSAEWAIEGLDPTAPVIFDVKSCKNTPEAACDRHINDMDYHVQRASYIDGATTLMPELAGRLEYVLVFVEVNRPHDVRFVRLLPSFRDLGEGQWGRAVQMWKRCMAGDYKDAKNWPGSGRKLYEVSAPRYAVSQENAIIEKIAREHEARMKAGLRA